MIIYSKADDQAGGTSCTGGRGVHYSRGMCVCIFDHVSLFSCSLTENIIVAYLVQMVNPVSMVS